MKKVMQWALMLVVGLAAFYGVKALKQKAMGGEPTAAEVGQQIDAMKAEAESTHPTLPKTDALKAVASSKSTQKLASLDSEEKRLNAAADMFFGYLFFNTKGRVQYCKERNVDISPFVSALVESNKQELARARAIYAQAGVDPESLWPQMEKQFAGVIEQDMKDITAGADIPLESACEWFVQNAELIPPLLKVQPEVRQALMGTK